MKNIYATLFGDSPTTQKARTARDSAFQSMLASRRQAAEQSRTDATKLAKYNALGNVITSMAQLGGWAAGGSTGNVQKYDDRQYLEAFNRAVKASDDLRNIGTAEDQYRFNLAEEDYKRSLARDEAERQRAIRADEAEQKYQRELEKAQQKFENDMAKQERQYELRRQLAEFNAAHKIVSRSTGLSMSEREKLKLIGAYNDYAKNAGDGEPVMTYPEWLEERGFAVRESGTGTSNTRDTKDTRESGGLKGDGRESGGLK